MDREDQEIQKKQKEEQKRLMNEASIRCQMQTSHTEERSVSEILPEVSEIAVNFAKNFVEQHPAIAAKIEEEEAKVKTLKLKPNYKPQRGLLQSVFSLSPLSPSYSSYSRFQLEELFKVLVLPEKSLEEFFRKMDQNTLKREFKKLALLLHPDKNAVSYAKIAFQKVFAVYQKCKC